MDAVVDTGLSHGTVIRQVGRRRAGRRPRHTLLLKQVGGGGRAGGPTSCPAPHAQARRCERPSCTAETLLWGDMENIFKTWR